MKGSVNTQNIDIPDNNIKVNSTYNLLIIDILFLKLHKNMTNEVFNNTTRAYEKKMYYLD